jgi:hypothetical protein
MASSFPKADASRLKPSPFQPPRIQCTIGRKEQNPAGKVWTVDELGGLRSVAQFCIPAGIGDASWVYSKLSTLGAKIGKEIIVTMPDEMPQRGHQLIELLPNVRWGGYVSDRTSWQIITQTLPGEWPAHMGLSPMNNPGPMNLGCNLWLEMGKKLSEWLPELPTDYHYPIAFRDQDRARADQLMREFEGPVVAVYTSNREKSTLKAGGWNLWDTQQWLKVLTEIGEDPLLKGCGYVVLGAEWDRDRSEDIAGELRQKGHQTVLCCGETLGTALLCLGWSQYFVAYPSGMGILANVLGTPGVMLLPWLIAGLEKAYADPQQMANNLYRAWPSPKPDDVIEWIREVGLVQANNYHLMKRRHVG